MFKKIILWVVFVGIAGLLIYGAVNRTLAKTNEERVESNVGGKYQDEGLLPSDHNGGGIPVQKNQQFSRSKTDLVFGNGQGRQDEDQTGNPDPQVTSGEWADYEGNVVSIDSSMILVEMEDGFEIMIEGRALVFMQDSGFVTNVGNTLLISGFYEDDEYKVATIIDQTTGESIVVRDEGGRPGWAGNGWGGSGSSDH